MHLIREHKTTNKRVRVCMTKHKERVVGKRKREGRGNWKITEA